MPGFFTCPQGHHWQTEDQGSTYTTVAPSFCPQCGAAGVPMEPAPAAAREVEHPPRKARPAAKAAQPGQAIPNPKGDVPTGRYAQKTVPPAEAQSLFAKKTVPPPDESANLHEPKTVPPIEPGAPSVAPAPLQVPGYKILGELGRGGMGVVYKAHHVKLKRLVALKMILAGSHAWAHELERFRHEAEAVARLQHPNIVQIHDIGEHNGLPYLALEFLDGGSLARRLADELLPIREVAELVETLAQAIHFAHKRHIVHRDLKPANILLTAEGTPKITDFGLAKQLDKEEGLTRTGAVMGTPAYMAPEQAQGRTKDIGPRTDVYALGALLYTLLTGQTPFEGPPPIVIFNVIHTDPPAPRTLNRRVPKDLETICLTCLEKDPTKRYVSGTALAADLQRFLRGEPIAARPVGALERGWRWCRRNPLVAGLMLGVALALLAGTAFSSYFALQADDRAKAAETYAADAVLQKERADAEANAAQTNAATAVRQKDRADAEAAAAVRQKERADTAAAVAATNERTALVEKAQAERQRERVEWLVYAEQIALAQHEWEVGNVANARDVLDACRWDFRHFEHRYLYTLFNKNQRTFLGHTAAVRSVAFSPDGRRLASASEDRTVKVWDIGSGREILSLKGHASEVGSVAFSPDGKRLASAAGGNHDAQNRSLPGEVKVWETGSGKEVLSLKGHTGWVSSVAFSPDGKRLASAGGNHDAQNRSLPGEVKVWETGSGKEVLSLKGHTGWVSSVAFSPDGKRLASAGADGAVKMWDTGSGREVLSLKGHIGWVSSVAFNPDGKHLAGAGADGTVKVWDTGSGQEVVSLKGHTDQVFSVAFSPDGQRLASAGGDRSLKVWDTGSGQEVCSLKAYTSPFNGWVTSVAFSPDGKRLASAGQDGTVKVWNSPDSWQGVLSLKGHTGGILSVAFSPDGKRLASSSYDGTVRVWDAQSGHPEVLSLKGHTGEVWSVAYSPDGKRLASASAGTWDAKANKRFPGEVKVWEAGGGREVLSLKGHTGEVTSTYGPNRASTLS